MRIKKLLVKFNDSALPECFVSLAVQVNKNREPFHAAILIRYKAKHYLHHHSGLMPGIQEIDETEDWLIYKIFDLIKSGDNSEVGAFLQYCRRVSEKSKMTYSFLMDGSSFSESGEFQSKVGLPELGTCVSYCVNTITKMLYDSDLYFNLEDWDSSTLPPVGTWLYDFAHQQTLSRYPELVQDEKYNAYAKRITPLEYLCSSFLSEYPITKTAINAIIGEVKSALEHKLKSN